MRREAFEERVDGWVRSAIDAGAENFGALLHSLPGVSPPEAAASLTRLKCVPATLRNLRASSGLIFGPFEGRVPHPLDYDWRFAPKAIGVLMAEIRERAGTSGPVALFGCPTLYRVVAQSETEVWLFDRNPPNDVSSDHAQSRAVNLLTSSVPRLEATVAVADPPWYPDHQAAFLWAAALTVRRGGYVISSAPPAGSRPSAENDWLQLVNGAKTFGLELVAIAQGALPYFTPPFEAVSFRAAQAPIYPVDWRRGDLTIFQRTSERMCSCPGYAPGASWVDHEVDGIRLMVRGEPLDRFDPKLIGIAPDDVLPSVSRRARLRERVAVWTSGNRIFGSNAPALVSATLGEMAQGFETGFLCEQVAGRGLCHTERESLKCLRDRLAAIVNLERAEYIDRGGLRGHDHLAVATES